MPFDRNQAGQNILEKRVFEGTLAKGRQKQFAGKLLASVQPTTNNPNLVRFNTDATEFRDGMIRITKGLLTVLHPHFCYSHSSFDVIYIHPEPSDDQLRMMGWLKTGEYWERGNGVFMSWSHVDEAKGKGAWMLVFYECFGFIVFHTNGQEIENMREKLRSEFPNYGH